MRETPVQNRINQTLLNSSRDVLLITYILFSKRETVGKGHRVGCNTESRMVQ